MLLLNVAGYRLVFDTYNKEWAFRKPGLYTNLIEWELPPYALIGLLALLLVFAIRGCVRAMARHRRGFSMEIQ